MKLFGKIEFDVVDKIKGKINIEVKEEDKRLKLKYPCKNNDCTPYKIILGGSKYLFELYGASGGYFDDKPEKGGHGAYTRGILDVSNTLTLYAYLGKQGIMNGEKTYNGGGKGTLFLRDNNQGGSGGGATDIRLDYASWHDLNSLKSRIMVSGGGAGSQDYYGFAQGGKSDIIGNNGLYTDLSGNHEGHILINATGGTQTFGGSACLSDDSDFSSGENGGFGYGGSYPLNDFGSGGGGGYYGGGSGCAIRNRVGSGAGGSSFVSGHPNCNAISKDYSETNPVH